MADALDWESDATGLARARTSRPKEVLDSWEEIAVFMKRGPRTVQRWEREEGLPVHPHQHARGSPVFARASEIREWLTTREAGSKPTSSPEPATARTKLGITSEELTGSCEAARARAQKARGDFEIGIRRSQTQASTGASSESQIFLHR